jgi:hypothetical protein
MRLIIELQDENVLKTAHNAIAGNMDLHQNAGGCPDEVFQVGMMRQEKFLERTNAVPGNLLGPAPGCDHSGLVKILFPVGSVVNQKGHPFVAPDVGVFSCGSRGVKDNGSKVFSDGNGHKARVGIILTVGRENRHVARMQNLSHSFFNGSVLCQRAFLQSGRASFIRGFE